MNPPQVFDFPEIASLTDLFDLLIDFAAWLKDSCVFINVPSNVYCSTSLDGAFLFPTFDFPMSEQSPHELICLSENLAYLDTINKLISPWISLMMSVMLVQVKWVVKIKDVIFWFLVKEAQLMKDWTNNHINILSCVDAILNVFQPDCWWNIHSLTRKFPQLFEWNWQMNLTQERVNEVNGFVFHTTKVQLTFYLTKLCLIKNCSWTEKSPSVS